MRKMKSTKTNTWYKMIKRIIYENNSNKVTITKKGDEENRREEWIALRHLRIKRFISAHNANVNSHFIYCFRLVSGFGWKILLKKNRTWIIISTHSHRRTLSIDFNQNKWNKHFSLVRHLCASFSRSIHKRFKWIAYGDFSFSPFPHSNCCCSEIPMPRWGSCLRARLNYSH